MAWKKEGRQEGRGIEKKRKEFLFPAWCEIAKKEEEEEEAGWSLLGFQAPSCQFISRREGKEGEKLPLCHLRASHCTTVYVLGGSPSQANLTRKKWGSWGA